ncbi:putative cytochrome P450 [Rosellinia necatrix]|uniref:Putative cytochrome P450 n=1 Tax=Rosellinia necatrix TaxID=77044 RepID=A0A1S8A758_ROSNE|nr:putative cytochrome P450 [Rosellinia necatrix]
MSDLIVLAATLLLVQILLKLRQCEPLSGPLSEVDAVGVSPVHGILRWPVAVAKSVTAMQNTMSEGYEKFSKNDKPFALPTMAAGGAVLVLPPSMLHLLKKPRSEISGFNALIDGAQFRYLMTEKDVWNNPIHFDCVRRGLPEKKMGPIAIAMDEEWDRAFRSCWGDARDGLHVNAWDSTVRIVAHAALRTLVGHPGCMNEQYLDQSIKYANAVLADGCIINCLPPCVRPILGRIIAIRARYHERKILKILVPMVEERMLQCDDKLAQEVRSVCPRVFRLTRPII